jgi:uncharacterized membrane protein YgdD (TMEM256/DUF423 family)
MNEQARLFLAAGAIAALLAVLLGAFGAHALKERVAADLMPVWRTGVEYHFYHALGLLAVGVLLLRLPGNALLKWAGWAMLAGILLFSGSLYLLALSGARWLGAVAPLGGAAFIIGWALLAGAVLRS